jgi:thymidylate synthase (FAD)
MPHAAGPFGPKLHPHTPHKPSYKQMASTLARKNEDSSPTAPRVETMAEAPQTNASPNKIPILDGAGFIELLDTFGDDLTVVNAARVSFAKESTTLDPRDGKLIKYLADHHHITPFFHPQARFRIKVPIYVAREWFRHTIGFARNEVSRRYVDDRPECFVPLDTQLRERDTNKKQGSKPTPITDSASVCEKIRIRQEEMIQFYEQLLALKVAPEVARGVLPQSMYTEFIETGSLSAYARLCGLRMDPHAQVEIQEAARAVSALLEPRFPVSWAALAKGWDGDAAA